MQKITENSTKILQVDRAFRCVPSGLFSTELRLYMYMPIIYNDVALLPNQSVFRVQIVT